MYKEMGLYKQINEENSGSQMNGFGNMLVEKTSRAMGM
jgi:hypothetical protein